MTAVKTGALRINKGPENYTLRYEHMIFHYWLILTTMGISTLSPQNNAPQACLTRTGQEMR